MNNRDELIWRNDALNACYEGWNWDDKTIEHIYENITQIPVAPHEMSAREFMSAFQQMCYKEYIDGCSACPLWQTTPKYDCMLRENDPQTIVAIVEKWAKEHPERSEDSVGN